MFSKAVVEGDEAIANTQISPLNVISSLLVAVFLKPRDEIHTAKDAPPHTG